MERPLPPGPTVKFVFGQKVITPEGVATVTSQQGFDVIVKMPNLQRRSFPIGAVERLE